MSLITTENILYSYDPSNTSNFQYNRFYQVTFFISNYLNNPIPDNTSLIVTFNQRLNPPYLTGSSINQIIPIPAVDNFEQIQQECKVFNNTVSVIFGLKRNSIGTYAINIAIDGGFSSILYFQLQDFDQNISNLNTTFNSKLTSKANKIYSVG